MANLPAKRPQSSALEDIDPLKVRVAELIADGQTIGAIAMRIAKGDKKVAARWRAKIRKWSYTDEAYQRALILSGRGKALHGAVGSISAVEKRAKRGRVDAAKFLGEVSGFHNNKISHEHSGEIQITISGLDRPKPVETVDSVVDAEVVED